MKWLKLVPQSVRAAVLAAKYHAKQTDLDGQPYVNHLRRVSRQTATAEESTVAWLHDIIEDTPVIATDLRDLGFSDRVVEAVLAITHLPDEPYDAYTERVLVNELAVTVKRYDLLDHVETGRGAEGRYGEPGWVPPAVMVGHPKLPIYVTFLERLGVRPASTGSVH